MTRLIRRLTAIVTFLAAVGASPVHAGLALDLADGTRVRVDEIASAGDAALRIAVVSPGVRVERAIPWPLVTGATLEGERYSTDELRHALGVGNGERGAGKDIEAAAFAPSFVPMSPPAHHVTAPLLSIHPPVPCPPFPIPCSPFPPRGRVIGVRPDPLAAYADLIPAIYPNGVPSTEAPFALALLRERRRLGAIGPVASPAPWLGVPAMPGVNPIPLPSSDVLLPAPGELSQIEARVVPLRVGGTADVNALGVELVGFDAAGRLVPVEGTAQATLYGGRQDIVRAFGDEYRPRPEGLVRIAEWTRAVEPGTRLLLPLPDPLPEHDPHVSPLGTLRIRVAAAGRGVFEALAEPVALRPESPLRDTLHAETGRRFLPDECTSGRPRVWPHRRDFTAVD